MDYATISTPLNVWWVAFLWKWSDVSCSTISRSPNVKINKNCKRSPFCIDFKIQKLLLNPLKMFQNSFVQKHQHETNGKSQLDPLSLIVYLKLSLFHPVCHHLQNPVTITAPSLFHLIYEHVCKFQDFTSATVYSRNCSGRRGRQPLCDSKYLEY